MVLHNTGYACQWDAGRDAAIRADLPDNRPESSRCSFRSEKRSARLVAFSTVPSLPFDGTATWRKDAGALPPVNRQLVEQEIFQQLVVTGQGLHPLPGQLQTKAFHPKMADLDRQSAFARSDFDPGVRSQMEENEIVQLFQESVLCRVPGISSASCDQTSAPTPGGISPAGVSGKAARSFRSCEKFLSSSRLRPREMDSNVGGLSAGK